MAQYRTDLKKIDSGQVTTRYEVTMLADQLTPSGTAVDAFGRLRVSEPYTVFDSTFRYSDDTRNWDTSLTGSGTSTHNVNTSAIAMTTSTSSGDKVIRQTKRYFVYQSGKSLLPMNTFTMQPKTNVRQRIGYFDARNGFFLEHDGTTAYIVKRSYVTGSVVDTRIAQADWSEDKFDGTGYSKVNIDFSKSQILWMDIEWLGVGTSRIGFVVDGRLYTAHKFHHANLITSTYMTTATLPIRYEIENTGTAASSTTLLHICNTIISEGGHTPRVSTRAVTTTLTGIELSNTEFRPLVAIRLKSTNTGGVVVPVLTDLFGLQTIAYNFKLISDATLTGGTWTSAGTESHVEYNITATAVSGGRNLMQGIFTGGTYATPTKVPFKDYNSSYQLKTRIDGTTETFIVAAQATTTNDDAVCSLMWEEYN